MSWLGLEGRTFLVTGVANRKSVAWKVAQQLEEAGATVVHSVRSEARRQPAAVMHQGSREHRGEIGGEPESVLHPCQPRARA